MRREPGFSSGGSGLGLGLAPRAKHATLVIAARASLSMLLSVALGVAASRGIAQEPAFRASFDVIAGRVHIVDLEDAWTRSASLPGTDVLVCRSGWRDLHALRPGASEPELYVSYHGDWAWSGMEGAVTTPQGCFAWVDPKMQVTRIHPPDGLPEPLLVYERVWMNYKRDEGARQRIVDDGPHFIALRDEPLLLLYVLADLDGTRGIHEIRLTGARVRTFDGGEDVPVGFDVAREAEVMFVQVRRGASTSCRGSPELLASIARSGAPVADDEFAGVVVDLRSFEQRMQVPYARRTAVSPDGRYAAVHMGWTVLVYDLARGLLRLAAWVDAEDRRLSYYAEPSWAPSGHRLVFGLGSDDSRTPSVVMDLDRNEWFVFEGPFYRGFGWCRE